MDNFYLKRNFLCECGQTHTFDSVVLEGIGDIESIKPRGTHVLYVGECDKVQRDLAKRFRLSKIGENQLSSTTHQHLHSPMSESHLRGTHSAILSHSKDAHIKSPSAGGELEAGFLPPSARQSNANHQLSAANHSAPPIASHQPPPANTEDIRLVVGQGNGINYAKYIAKMMNLECVIIGSGEFFLSSIIQNKSGEFNLIKTPPHYIVPHIGEHALDLCHSFAAAVLCSLSMLDYYITQDQKVCPQIFEKAMSISKDLIGTASKTNLVTSPILKEAILDANLKLAILNEYVGIEHCLSMNGALQATAALFQIFKHDKWKKITSLHSGALVLSGAVIKTYEAFLEKNIEHCPPPDNALRIEKMCFHLGIKEAKAIRMMPEYIQRIEIERRDYMLELFRHKHLGMISSIRKLLGEALYLFFGMLPDGGFEYKDYADSLEVGLCLGLGADVLKGRTLLSMMRDKGVLEKML